MEFCFIFFFLSENIGRKGRYRSKGTLRLLYILVAACPRDGFKGNCSSEERHAGGVPDCCCLGVALFSQQDAKTLTSTSRNRISIAL